MKKIIFLFAMLTLCVSVQPLTTKAAKAHNEKFKREDEYRIGYVSQNGNDYELWVTPGANRTAWVINLATNVLTTAVGRVDPVAHTTTFTYNPTGSQVILYQGSYY